MKTLARTKKRLNPTKFELWLEGFVFPQWVFKYILGPLVIVGVLIAGMLVQLFYPVFALPAPTTEYHAAQLTADEVWRINTYTCESIDRMQSFMEATAEEQDPAAFLKLAYQERAILGIVLEPWNTYADKKVGRKDWRENAQAVWERVIKFVPLWPDSNKPWFAKAHPKYAGLDSFKTYINVVMEQRESDRLSDWMISIKHCNWAPHEPAATPIVNAHDADDAKYCSIYAQFNTLNFDDPAAVAIWAQRNREVVASRGTSSLDWSQVEGEVHALLSVASDANLPFANASQWHQANESAPIAILRNRIEGICG